MKDYNKPYNVSYPWKPFKISLGRFSRLLTSIAGPNFAGISATPDNMIVHFKETPSVEHLNRVQMEYDALTSESESKKFIEELSLEEAIKAAKENILLADLSTLIPAERKLLMGMSLTNEDKAEILKKYN